MRVNPHIDVADVPADRHINQHRLFESATDRNSVSDLLYLSRPPKWERLVHPAPETDPALLVDGEVES